MPLPSKPGSVPSDNNPSQKVAGPPPKLSSPPSPVGKVEPAKIMSTPEEDPQAQNRVLGDEDRYRHRKDLGDLNEGNIYQALGSITAEEVINVPYEKVFKRLEGTVLEVKNWLQEFITNQDLTEAVGAARANRGPKLVEVKNKLDQLLFRYFASNSFPQADVSRITSLVLNEILGFGPIEPLWQDKTITEIMINGPKVVYIERNGKLQKAVGVQFRDSDHVLELTQQILGSIGRTLDIAHPYEDGRLQDGSRINSTHPVIGPNGPYVTIRRFPEEVFSIRKLLSFDSMTPAMAEEIGNLIYHKCSMIISGGTGSGKQLDDRTLLPTPTGWVTMGEVKVGDFVLNHKGNPTKVTGKFQDKPNVEAYTVHFSDGNSIVADADHNWFTYTEQERKGFGSPKVRTTKEILNSLSVNGSDNFNHAIKVSGVANYSVDRVEERLIEPYVLGQWLSDTSESNIAVKVSSESLEALNLVANKHIPDSYLIAPEKVRRELLAGLLDVGGTLRLQGYVSFHSSNNDLLNQVRVLLQSLGYIVNNASTLEGKNGLTFQSTVPVFRNSSKAELHEKIMENKAADFTSQFRYITSIVPYTEPVTMHCITVDNDDHLYLAGEGFITTHNTSMLNALSGAIPRDQRIVTIEDNLELRLHPEAHVVSLESKKALQDNKIGTVTIRDLVRNSLRQRPDRIVVGEVRDGAAYDMLQAMNTGHEGSLTTIHANSPKGAIERLSNLIAQIGELDSNQSLTLISSGVDVIIQINRYEDGSRRVSSIAEIPPRVEVLPGGSISLEPRIIWEFRQTGFDEKNRIVGEYVHVNDYSEDFIKQHRLHKKRRLELDEILSMSDWTTDEETGLSASEEN